MSQAGIREELGFIASLVRKDLGVFGAGVGGAAVYALGAVGATVVFGRLVDNVIVPVLDDGDDTGFGPIAAGAAVVIIVALLRIGGVVTRRFYAGMTSERVARRRRTDLTNQYVRLPMAFHRQRAAGDLIAHVDNDTEVLVQVIHPLPFSLAVVFIAVFAGIAMLLVDWVLALVALAVFPAIAVFNRFYSRRIAGPAASTQASVGALSAMAHESFDGALVVKLLGLESTEQDRFEAKASELRGHRVRVGWLRAWFEAALDMLPRLGVILVMVVGAWRVSAGAVTVGDLLQIATLFSVLALPMRVLGYFLEEVPPAMAARDRLATVPDTRPTIGDRSDLSASAPVLAISNLVVGWDDAPANLTDIELQVAPGETVALVGGTGSGKSTLVKAIAGELDPRSGQILLAGTPVSELAPEVRADAMRFAFQEAFLFADTVTANVALDRPGIDEASVDSALDAAQASEFVEALADASQTVVGQRGLTLSGGQRQRIALARALVGEPRLVVVDDAFSAVDAEVERRILHALRHREPAPAMLIVAHRLSTIRLADRVVFLSGGTVAAVGSHDELLEIPEYEALATAYEQQEQAA